MHKNRILNTLLVLLAVLLLMPACTSKKDIRGTITAYGSYPVAERRLALCKVQNAEQAEVTYMKCELQSQVAVSDNEGKFTFVDPGEGMYLILYEDFLGDFDQGMQDYAGQILEIGNPDWMVEQFGDENDTLNYHVFAESANLIVNKGFDSYAQYCWVLMMVGGSPFAVAHDTPAAMQDGSLKIIIVEPGQQDPIEFPALDFDL